MTQKIVLLMTIVFSAACNNDPKKTATGTEVANDRAVTGSVATAGETLECYVNTSSKDSVMLHLTFTRNTVSGSMHYHILGKDKNQGTLQGVLKGDTIFADYAFSSEGKESVRQVAYLKKDNSLLEGYGNVEEKGGRMVFTNTGALNFGKGVVLQKTDCKK